METLAVILVVLAIVVLFAMAWVLLENGRTATLRGRFGPEYFHVVEQQRGNRRRAEQLLLERARRVRGFRLRPLASEDRVRFASRWSALQTRFVDDPTSAVAQADRLVAEVIEARGYPTADFEQRAADLSVHHPRLVDHYRAARRIAERSAGGQATTEELRNAVVSYRSLFAELLEQRGRDQEVLG